VRLAVSQRRLPLPVTSGSYTACKRLLSRVPTLIEHNRQEAEQHAQFYNVAINPSDSNEVMGGHADNGTWSNLGDLRKTFAQVIYGAGW